MQNLIFILIHLLLLNSTNDAFKNQLRNQSYGYSRLTISEELKAFVEKTGNDSLKISHANFWPVNAEINFDSLSIRKMDYGVLKVQLKTPDSILGTRNYYTLLCVFDHKFDLKDKKLIKTGIFSKEKTLISSEVLLKKSSQDTIYKYNYSSDSSNINVPLYYWPIQSVNLILIQNLKISIKSESFTNEKIKQSNKFRRKKYVYFQKQME